MIRRASYINISILSIIIPLFIIYFYLLSIDKYILQFEYLEYTGLKTKKTLPSYERPLKNYRFSNSL